MKHVAKQLLIVLVALTLTTVCWAEKSILVVYIKDIHENPVAGVTITLEGAAESGTSDPDGKGRIKLDPQTEVNDWVALHAWL